MGPPVEVVAAVIRRHDDAILIALRRPDQHQGNLWEFPGGKLRPREASLTALARELEEELGIRIESAQCRPLVRLEHAYPDKHIRLDVSEVFAWTGEARGREGQRIAWVWPAELAGHPFPEANLRIVQAALLPRVCLITPEPEAGREPQFLRALAHGLAAGIRLVQLRIRSRPLETLTALVTDAVALCHGAGARVLLNVGAVAADSLDARWNLCALSKADGIHLPSSLLHQDAFDASLRPAGKWVSAACHDVLELRAAESAGVDFVFLGTVLPSASHPGSAGLGWARAAELAGSSRLPVFALGGQHAGTVNAALEAGFHGIAAIRGFWDEVSTIPDARLRPSPAR